MIDLKFNMASLIAKLEGLSDDLPQKVDAALQECGQAIAQEESSHTKGKLSESFYTFKQGDTQYIDSHKSYAKYIEYGRGPVTAINAKALRFVINGEVIFRKSVGPAKAQPFMKESIKSAQTRFNDIFKKNLGL